MLRNFSHKIWIIAAAVLSSLALTAYFTQKTHTSEQELPETVDYNFHIRPLLSDRCFACHGPDEKKRQAGLRLDTPEGAFAALGDKKDHFAIVPGHPEQSTLVQRIHAADPEERMPPAATHLNLTEYEKALLQRWIEQGAVYAPHWAFTPPVKAPLPKVRRNNWARNELDVFLLAKMEEKGLKPAPEAEKNRLLRRLCFDITGLPPTPQQMQQFLQDTRPDAYERMVDTLLASPAYGERMTMNWLDLARYSDTHGYQDDLPRIMWPWRDWVIQAFNTNMPYDQFVSWQLAGDLLPNATKAQILATGFNRNHKITQEGGVIDEEYRVEYVADRTNTFGKAFLGLTVECARCHDHKYDPIPTRDYYALSAFFNNVPEKGFVPNLQTPEPWMAITSADLGADLPFLNAQEAFKTPKDTLRLMVMAEQKGHGPRPTFILRRGQYDQHGDSVQASAPRAILPWDANLPANRLGLSQWLFDPKHPLTARVTVNRIWQEIFGRGIVATPDNFGMQGALPTHPELLDWLACDLQEHHWDLKRLIRQMVTSAAYRQSAEISADQLEKDPENKWLARGASYRWPYEFIRDQVLATSGLLIPQIGGPSVKPYQPPGLWEEISTEKTANAFRGEFSYVPDTSAAKMYRRSIYTYNKRTIPPPGHLIFDAPMRDLCTLTRTRTSTPLQALVLLNDRQVLEAARALAQFYLKNTPADQKETAISAAFERIVCRKPQSGEQKSLTAFYRQQEQHYRDQPSAARELLQQSGPYPIDTTLNPAETCALMLSIQILYNLDEVLSKT
ncbi:MAG: DUF1549 domain-containing protein [Bacteroidetes bacterium]|nr:DUF1549 domain-containing protein [Bacteroidota bacterium]